MSGINRKKKGLLNEILIEKYKDSDYGKEFVQAIYKSDEIINKLRELSKLLKMFSNFSDYDFWEKRIHNLRNCINVSKSEIDSNKRHYIGLMITIKNNETELLAIDTQLRALLKREENKVSTFVEEKPDNKVNTLSGDTSSDLDNIIDIICCNKALSDKKKEWSLIF